MLSAAARRASGPGSGVFGDDQPGQHHSRDRGRFRGYPVADIHGRRDLFHEGSAAFHFHQNSGQGALKSPSGADVFLFCGLSVGFPGRPDRDRRGDYNRGRLLFDLPPGGLGQGISSRTRPPGR